MESLAFVKFKRHLKKSDLEKQLVEIMEQRITALPNYPTLRLNPELILLACNLIENGLDKAHKINKKELCIKVLNSIFTYNNVETQQVDDTIEFLHCTKKIKKVSLTHKFIVLAWDWVKRKLL